MISENMFKKHLHGWGLYKNMKAEHKDAAILRLAEGSSPPQDGRKILRHARSRVKAGTLDEVGYQDVLQQAKQASAAQAQHARALRLSPATKIHASIGVIPDLLPPDTLLRREKLFTNVRLLVLTNTVRRSTVDTKNIKNDRWGLDNQGYDIGVSIESGITHWGLCSFKKARGSFGSAAKMLHSYLEHGSIPIITLIYYLNPDMWGRCWEHYQRFVVFVGNLAEAIFNQDHPLVQLTRAISHEHTKDDGSEFVRIWDCIMDNLVLSSSNVKLWCDAARKRLDHYIQYGMFEQAKACSQGYTHSLQAMDLLNDGMTIDLKYEVARCLTRQGEIGQAMTVFSQVVFAASRCLHRYDWYVGAAHNQMGRIHEYGYHNVLSAQLHYVEAFRTLMAFCGSRHSETLSTLRDLLDFCHYYRLQPNEVLDTEEYQESYEALETFTSGLWTCSSTKF